MRTKHQLDLEAFLADSPVFSLGDLAVARGDGDRLEPARNQLKHHLRTGRIKAVSHGIFAAVPPGILAARFHPDPFLVGLVARPDAIFAYHAALELQGVSYAVRRDTTLFTARRRTAIDLGTKRVVFLPHPQPLMRRGLAEIGTIELPGDTRSVRGTGPERTLVEGFRNPSRVGGIAELLESAAGIPLLRFPVLEAVLEAYDQRSLWAALGWYLTRQAERLEPPAELLARCRANRPRSNQYLVASRRAQGGSLVRDWRLILPPQVVRGFDTRGPDT